MKRYRFINDDDGHWYLIPADLVEDFENWLEAGPYWDGYKGIDFSEYSIGGHPSFYTFENPKSDE